MASIKELEKRVTAVEVGMKEVRTLAAGASQDAADYMAALRGHKMSLDALNTTQGEQLVALKDLADNQTKQFAELGVTQLEQSMQLQALDGKVLVLDGKVDRLDAKVDLMSEEMRAIRETQLDQQADIEKLRESSVHHWTELQDVRRTQLKNHADTKSELKGLRGDVEGLKGDVAGLKGDVAGLKGDVAGLKGDVAELAQGMTRIAEAVERLSDGYGSSKS